MDGVPRAPPGGHAARPAPPVVHAAPRPLRAGFHGPPRPMTAAESARDSQLRAMRARTTPPASTAVAPPSAAPANVAVAAPPEPASSSSRKRRGDGDDEMRDELVRDDDFDYPVPDDQITSLDKKVQFDEGLNRADKFEETKSRSHGDDEAKVTKAMKEVRVQDDMKVIRSRLGCSNDVSEVYSPPRVVTVAAAAGLRAGFSLDLTVPKPEGGVWDFSRRSCRDAALKLTREQRPYLLIGSPPCTAWSNLQNLNACRPGGRARVGAAKQRARVHLLFCCRLYREQLEGGR